MKKKKEKVRDLVKLVITFFIFYYSVYFQYIPIILMKWKVKDLTGSQEVFLSTFSSICLLLVLFIMYRKEIIKEFKIFKENMFECFDTGISCWVVGLVIMMVSNIIISFVLKGGQAGNEETVQSMIKALPWLMLIDAGIIAPINEEIVFRKTFKNLFNNKWVFVISSGFVFGLLHVLGNVDSFQQALYIIPYGALGASFAYSYYKTNTIFTPISMHMLHNTILVIASIIRIL